MLLQTTLPRYISIFTQGTQPWSGTPEAEEIWKENMRNRQEKETRAHYSGL